MTESLAATLRRAARGFVNGVQRGRYRLGLAIERPTVPGSDIAVYDGGVLAAGGTGLVHGGKVKLVHLGSHFPGGRDRFNVLYLVSSSQPRFAVDLVRWAKSRGVRFVWNQNGVAYPAWAGEELERFNGPMRELLGLADFVVYQSEFCRTSADRFLAPAPCPWAVLHNCVDTAVFRPAAEALETQQWVLLAAGSHQQAGRVLRVLDVVAILRSRGRPARLVLAGPLDWAGAAAQVSARIKALGLNEAVTVLPPYTQAQAPDLYRRAHVLVHLKYMDPCPTVPIEAMACGLPVVGSHSGGMPELVGDDGGVLLPVAHSWEQMHLPAADAVATAVERLFRDLPVWSRQARARAVARFDCHGWLDGHGRIFAGLLPGAGATN